MNPNKELVKTAYELYKNKSNIKFIRTKPNIDNIDIHYVGNNKACILARKPLIKKNEELKEQVTQPKK